MDTYETQSLAAEVQQLRADFARLAETLQATVRERGGETFDKAQAAAGRIAQEIRQKPVAAAMAVFGIGMILGVIFGARRG